MQNQIPKGPPTPRLRRTSWRKVKLGEVMTLHRGYDLPVNKMSRGNYPVVFSNGKIEYHSKFKKKGPGIITGRSGALGNVFYVEDDYWPHNTTLFIDDFHNNEPKFLYYLLKSLSFSYLNSGTGVPTLNRNYVHELLISVPENRSYQKQIASVLSAFDDKIEVNNKIAKTLEDLDQAIFKEWFVKFRFPGYDKVKFVDSELGKIPEGWKVKKLSDVVSTQYGYTETASEKEIGPKFLRVMDINKADWINWSSVPYCKVNESDSGKYILNVGDIVIARMADPGKVAIIEESINAVFASYLIRLKPKSNNLSPYYLYYYLRSPQYQGFIFGSSTGTTRQSANARVITDCYFALPENNLIQKFEHTAGSIRKMIRSRVQENQKLAEMRDLLLPKLMKGEIRI